jgi:CDP-diacylglycerol pyrophosphatase
MKQIAPCMKPMSAGLPGLTGWLLALAAAVGLLGCATDFSGSSAVHASPADLQVALQTGGQTAGNAGVSPPKAKVKDADVLWRIVGSQCVPGQIQHGQPAPCALVDIAAGEANGYAVLKDRTGVLQFLLIPSTRITGIESPVLLRNRAPNYWAAAWQARHFMVERSGQRGNALVRENIGLAINSASGRSQNQLHIHIDCVRPDVKQLLAAHESEIGLEWTPLTVPLVGQHYLARRLVGAELGNRDPFKLLADEVKGAKEDMGRHTLVLVGARFRDGQPGFYLLDDHVGSTVGDRASGEDLMDHDCAVLP